MPSSIGINLRVTGHCSQGGRKYMEDFFSVAYQQSEDEKDLEYAFFGIYDGHGGSEAATFAKENLMNEIVSQKLFWSDSDQDVLRAIREGYIATHYAMWREQEKWPKTSTGLPSTAGTTASVAFIRRGKIYIGHVGDSGIVLGYQEEGEKYWRAKALTHDHKPECNVEMARILNSGGKVITKSGVPRVVWNRPRIGHKGPVRRSTPIDEIPFLAVARSLGDLWSYNSALNEFVVSPDPDVKVMKIDPKSFRCLIFGTDGLWNVLSPGEAVNQAFEAELINERIALGNCATDWTNPSKVLVDRALGQWSSRRMRADNTSVVTIMLDPPGPPKKDMIRSCPAASYGLEYTHSSGYVLQPEYVSSIPSAYGIDDGENDILYEPNHRRDTEGDQMVVDSFSTNGYAVMTRYDDFECDSDESDTLAPIHSSSSSSSSPDVNLIVNSSAYSHQYMNSFAESYNSLLISSYGAGDEAGEDESECFDSVGNNMMLDPENAQHSNQYQLHQYQQQCISAGEGYSLTKLETRGEQQFNSMRNYTLRESVSFQDFGEDTEYNQYNSISSSYQNVVVPTDNLTVEIRESNDAYGKDSPFLAHKEKDYCGKSPIVDNDRGKLESEPMRSDSDRGESCSLDFDESIQINEISSSIVDTSTQDITALLNVRENIILRRPRARGRNVLDNSLVNVEQNENNVISEPRRLRSSIMLSVNYSKRTLRSRNTLAKDLKAKTRVTRTPPKRSTITKVLKSSSNTALSLSGPSTHSSTNQRSLVWSQRQQQQRKPTIVQSAIDIYPHSDDMPSSSSKAKQSLANSKFHNNKPKSSSRLTKRMLSTSLAASPTTSKSCSNLVTSSQLSIVAKRASATRNSAWCCPAVQTRNRVQKRNSH